MRYQDLEKKNLPQSELRNSKHPSRVKNHSLHLSISKLRKDLQQKKFQNDQMKDYFGNVDIKQRKKRKKSNNDANNSQKKSQVPRKRRKTKIIIKNHINGDLYISSKFKNSPRPRHQKIQFEQTPKLYQSDGGVRKKRARNHQKLKNSKFQVNPNVSQTILFKNSSIEKFVSGYLKNEEKSDYLKKLKKKQNRLMKSFKIRERRTSKLAKNRKKEKQQWLAKKGQVSYGFLENYDTKKKIKKSVENFKILSKKSLNRIPNHFDASNSAMKITSVAHNPLPLSRKSKAFMSIFF